MDRSRSWAASHPHQKIRGAAHWRSNSARTSSDRGFATILTVHEDRDRLLGRFRLTRRRTIANDIARSQLQSGSRCARRSRLSRRGSVSSDQIPNIAGRCAILSERNPARERAPRRPSRSYTSSTSSRWAASSDRRAHRMAAARSRVRCRPSPHRPAAPVEPLGVAVEHATTRMPLARPEQAVARSATGSLTAASRAPTPSPSSPPRRRSASSRSNACSAAPANVRMADAMDADPPVVGPGEDQEVVAWKMVRQARRWRWSTTRGARGIVPSRRMLDVLLSEPMRTWHGSAATWRAPARPAAPPKSRSADVVARLPWLIGLAGAMASVAIVGAFEEELDRKVLLAFSIPASSTWPCGRNFNGDAAVPRPLGGGHGAGRGRAELMTGGDRGYPRCRFLRSRPGLRRRQVRGGGGAGTVGELLDRDRRSDGPSWRFRPLGIDPALVPGPLATMIQDLLDRRYFAIAVPIAT